MFLEERTDFSLPAKFLLLPWKNNGSPKAEGRVKISLTQSFVLLAHVKEIAYSYVLSHTRSERFLG